jgi:hypothetical protein
MPEIEVSYDKKEQKDRILEYIIRGETLYAVFACKGKDVEFVGITDQRVIFYERSLVPRRRVMVSIPYDHVLGIAAVDEGAFLQSGELVLLTHSGNFAFEFMRPDRVHWTYHFIINQILNQPEPQMKV